MTYTASPIQANGHGGATAAWGDFGQYAEYADDGFALRCVREHANGFLTRHDRDHGMDQFGTLPDFRYGKAFVATWGEPDTVSPELFESKWSIAEASPPDFEREPSPPAPCPWIALFETGQWEGQP